MKKLYVFADFDWLKEPRFVGELSYESLRGSDSYGFCYSNEWLKDYGSLFLSDDLNNYPGQQYTAPGKDIFGCFSDALPDRWGRTLINRREQILAKKTGINVAETRVISTNDKYYTLLSRRFDRREDGKRIHFASAMILLGLNDGANAIQAMAIWILLILSFKTVPMWKII